MSLQFSSTHSLDDEASTGIGDLETSKRRRRGEHGTPHSVAIDDIGITASMQLLENVSDTHTQISVFDPISMVARKSLHAKEGGDMLQDATKHCKLEYPPTDLLSFHLTEDVIFKILNFLSPHDLVHRLGMVNKHYFALSQNDVAGWDIYYAKLLQTKLHVAVADPFSNFRTAWRMANIDSKRPFITKQELCYDPATHQGTIWSFRFKESAGTDWTSVDPWYLGQPCRKMVFLSNGTMLNVVYPSSTGSLNTPNESLQLVEPPLRMTWRFLTRPMDLPTRPMGSYIRIQVGGRDVPTYAASRSPTGNWGFVLESCWGIYASFELPKRIAPPNVPPNAFEAGSVLRRGSELWIPVGDEILLSEIVPLPAAPTLPSDMQDESMSLTNEIQWREAFLYNVGARVLPEGDEATDEFDRFWRNGGNNHPHELP